MDGLCSDACRSSKKVEFATGRVSATRKGGVKRGQKACAPGSIVVTGDQMLAREGTSQLNAVYSAASDILSARQGRAFASQCKDAQR